MGQIDNFQLGGEKEIEDRKQANRLGAPFNGIKRSQLLKIVIVGALEIGDIFMNTYRGDEPDWW